MEIHLGDNEEAEKNARIHSFWETQVSSLGPSFDPKPTQKYRFCHLHPLYIHVVNVYI